jgi:predicted RNA-binding protein YlxR (DUF448 family)
VFTNQVVEQRYAKDQAVGGSYITAYRNCSDYKNGKNRTKTAHDKAVDDKTTTKLQQNYKKI